MKNIITLLLFVNVPFFLLAQYQIGHTSLSITDDSRSRLVTAEVYYPAENAGDDVSFAAGEFPTIVFGHGFVMTWDVYQNIWDHLVPLGYVLVFATTENNIPSHGDFGLDLSFLANSIYQLSLDDNLFTGKLTENMAVIGHSMGGGAAFLAANGSNYFKTVIGLAPAETTPSAIAEASNINLPTLIFSGSADGVTPPEEHHLPIYENIISDCKLYINILGGAHCYFANASLTCDFGESLSSPNISIDRESQQIILFDYLDKWLNFHLNDNQASINEIAVELPIDQNIDFDSNCFVSDINQNNISTSIDLIYPNPSKDQIHIKWKNNINKRSDLKFKIYNTAGHCLINGIVNPINDIINIDHLNPGYHSLVFYNQENEKIYKFIKL